MPEPLSPTKMNLPIKLQYACNSKSLNILVMYARQARATLQFPKGQAKVNIELV